MNDKNRKKSNETAPKEEYAVILDYLSHGYINTAKNNFDGKPVAQAIGVDYFTLLELIPKKGVDLDMQEKVYIGNGKRDKVKRVNRKLNIQDLTTTAEIEIDYAIQDLVKDNEEKYVDFFNNSQGISLRKHSLEFIPKIGKKQMLRIIEAREEKPFESFDDISARITGINDPAALIAKRIKDEIDVTKIDKNKYYLFVKDPRNKEG